MKRLRSIPFLALLLLVVPSYAHTNLTMEPLTIHPTPAVQQRLSALDASIPRCNETGEILKLAFDAAVTGVPAARISTSLELSLGPTIGREGAYLNILQDVKGTLTTGQNGQRRTWRVSDLNAGPFSGRIVRAGGRVVFWLPSRMDSDEAGAEPVYAMLGVRCTESDGALKCGEATFLFEKAYASIFRASPATDRLFHPALRDQVRAAAADAEAAAKRTAAARRIKPNDSHSPFLDCCIGSWWCACQDCEPGSGGQCGTMCDNCLADACFNCDFGGCLPC